ncbi:MAG: OsmC family protein [Chloroflexi bacterium]|nr:OsmC family protein [Chloroflexota bacterium]
MAETVETAASDVQSNERIQSIHVNTEYLGGYQSVNHVRDLPDIYLDEPKELGGKNSGPTPLETTLCALNSCTAMIMNILRREMRFDLQGVRFETEGQHDVRRVEMKRTGKLYSQVEPIAYHYHKVHQKVFIRTSESGERLEKFRAEVERLCPLHALLRDAKVNVQTDWVLES